jgi:predicted signal transduction protein with EAL and GGDEF domain
MCPPVEDKQRGYRSLSTFLDSDENFMLYRRFGYLHSRMLLRKQDELRKLEAELDEIDELDAIDGTPQRRRLLMSRDSDEAADRREPEGIRTRTMILDEIEQKLEKYGLNFPFAYLNRLLIHSR